MRKVLAIGTALVMILVGFMAMVAPAAAQCSPPNEDWFWKSANSACGSFQNDAVPLGTHVGWILTIYVQNNFGEVMTDVVIKDRLGGELMVCEDCPGMPNPYTSQGVLDITTKGKTEKVFLDWDVGTIGTIQPDNTATLTLLMATDMNPGGHQEYTSPGDYMLNSGATIKYKLDGVKFSESTDSVWITVVEP